MDQKPKPSFDFPYQEPDAELRVEPWQPRRLPVLFYFFGIRGRIPRRVFWICSLFTWIVFGLATHALEAPNGRGEVDGLQTLASGLFLYVSIAIHIKRWHDVGRSGVWVFVIFLPFLGPIWALVELGFCRGTSGPNRYGDDPTIRRYA